ncbi:MAG: sensor histidine kinase [Bacillota bacterium]
MKKNNSLKRTLIVIFILIIISLVISSTFSYFTFQNLQTELNNTTDSIYAIKDLIRLNKQLDSSLSDYAYTKKQIHIQYIYANYQKLLIRIEEFNEKVKNKQSSVYLDNIYTILNNKYIDQLELTISSVRGVDESKIANNYYESKKITKYINTYLNMLLNNELENSRKEQILLKEDISVIVQRVAIILVLNLGLILFIGISYGRNLILNISKLTNVAEEISKGNFDISPIELKSTDETHILAKAFNKLINNTKKLINKIKENAELEVKLHKEELEKSQVQNLLKEAKLKGLQSQINPHFLFNTLNIVSKLAILEDADETSELINNVSDMFRYNLGKLDQNVSVKEEVENIENYIFIQKKRFGNRVKFEIDIDKNIINKKIPFLTLQPIVENAFIHGISELESNAIIKIYSVKKNNKLYLVVKDNGNGMNQSQIDSLLNENDNDGHSTGIGVNNVKQRLEYFHNKNNVLFIESEKNSGTKVYILID